MDILAIAGSLRQGSYNRQLAEAAGAALGRLHPEAGFRLLAWDDVPLMNQDIEHPAPSAGDGFAIIGDDHESEGDIGG